MSISIRKSKSHRKSGAVLMPTIQSEDDGEASKVHNIPVSQAKDVRAESTPELSSAKRAGDQLESNRPPKTNKVKDSGVVQSRTRSFMVVRNVGEQLSSEVQPLELAETLRDAIKCTYDSMPLKYTLPSHFSFDSRFGWNRPPVTI